VTLEACRKRPDASTESLRESAKRSQVSLIGAGAAVTSMGYQATPALVNFGKELFSLGQSSEIALAKSETVFGDSAARSLMGGWC
jgi:hypothetical protein